MENIHNYQLAKENFEYALLLDPNSAEAHYNYALLLIDDKRRFNQLRDSNKIRFHLLESIRIHSISSYKKKADIVHYALANFLFEYDNHNEAQFHYEKCIEINPSFFQAHCNLALLLKRTGKYKLAKHHYEIALSIEPKDYITHNNLANMLWKELGKLELADYHYRQLEKLNPNYHPENYANFKQNSGYKSSSGTSI